MYDAIELLKHKERKLIADGYLSWYVGIYFPKTHKISSFALTWLETANLISDFGEVEKQKTRWYSTSVVVWLQSKVSIYRNQMPNADELRDNNSDENSTNELMVQVAFISPPHPIFSQSHMVPTNPLFASGWGNFREKMKNLTFITQSNLINFIYCDKLPASLFNFPHKTPDAHRWYT